MHKGLMPYGKYRRFLQKELDLDNFIARQLTDTAYISSATAEYLRCLFERDHHVLGLKGQHTAELRRQWGLNNILSDLPDSPAWQGQSLLRPGEKNRADHRHHAIDAIVAALTNRSCLQQLSKSTQEIAWTDSESRETIHWRKYSGNRIESPWEDFRNDVAKAVSRINVSHRPERKVAGALHEETLYGATAELGVFVVRKPLDNLSPNEVPLIRDAGVRRTIEARLAEHGIEIGRGKKVDSKKLKQALCDASNPVLLPPSRKRLKKDPHARGIPIRKVRVLRKEKTIQPIRRGTAEQAYVKPGATHHLCLFEWQDTKGKTKRDAVFVTQLEAINRVKNGEQLIQRHPPANHPTIPSDAKFVMSLSRGEMVLAETGDGERLLTFRTAAATSRQMWFSEHTDARKSTAYRKLSFMPSTFSARKVTVDPLGRIRWAND